MSCVTQENRGCSVWSDAHTCTACVFLNFPVDLNAVFHVGPVCPAAVRLPGWCSCPWNKFVFMKIRVTAYLTAVVPVMTTFTSLWS